MYFAMLSFNKADLIFLFFLFLLIFISMFLWYTIKSKIDKQYQAKDSVNIPIWFFGIAALGFVIFSFCAPSFYKAEFPGLGFGALGEVGDLVGGLMNPFIGIAAVIVTGLAFYAQYQANEEVKSQFKLQQKAFERERFDSHVYKLVDIYRDNVANWSKLDKKTWDTFTGRLVPITVLETYDVFLKELNLFIILWEVGNANFFVEEYKDDLSKLIRIKETENNLGKTEDSIKEWMKMELAYLVVFFGLDDKGRENIKLHLENRYDKDFVDSLVNFFSYKITHYDDDSKKFTIRFQRKNKSQYPNRNDYDQYSLKNYEYALQTIFNETDNIERPLEDIDFSYKYYNGIETLFSHHYRHLHSAYKYINEFKQVDYLTRWKVHAKLIRTQMSNSEQVLFFLNSISILGRDWELNHKIDSNDIEKNRTKLNNRLVTKYDIIKNIPKGDRANYKIELFYPHVEWEDIPMTEENKVKGERYENRSKFEKEYY